MGLNAEVRTGIKDVLAPEWNTVNGTVVPKTADIVLRNGAVKLNATYVYADMADSTGLAQRYEDWAVAKVIRCYLNAASRILRANGGEIRSFDGDRVMAIFIGEAKNTSAVRAAMQISWSVLDVIKTALNEKWDSLDWTMTHGVGIDTGEAMLVRGGVRGDNDLISVGGAPNVAAKLSEFRTSRPIHISDAVRNNMHEDVVVGDDGMGMWIRDGYAAIGGKSVLHHSTSYYWVPA